MACEYMNPPPEIILHNGLSIQTLKRSESKENAEFHINEAHNHKKQVFQEDLQNFAYLSDKSYVTRIYFHNNNKIRQI